MSINSIFQRAAVAWSLAALLTAFAPAGPSDAVAADPDDRALLEEGRKVFRTIAEVGCAACHGFFAEGDLGIGPYNRGVGEAAIRAAIKGVEQMEFLREEITERQIKAIAAYYAYLGKLQLQKTLVKRGRFMPDAFSVYPGTRVQLVLKNSSVRPRSFAGDGMSLEPFTVPPRSASDVVWTAPSREGAYSLRCTNCRLKGEKLTITVSRTAKRHAAPAPRPVVQVATATDRPLADSLIKKGREVFLTAAGVGCIACHGPYAEGDVGIGPYNRGLGEAEIRTALRRVEQMRFLAEEMTETEIRQVAAYYASLGEKLLVKTNVVRGRFIPGKISVHPATKIQLVVNNRDPQERRLSARSLGLPDLSAPGRSDVDLVWTAPAREGAFSLTCANCALKGQKLTIEVTKRAPKFVPRNGTRNPR